KHARFTLTALACILAIPLLAAGVRPGNVSLTSTPEDRAIPRYRHIFVIIEENKDEGSVIGAADAPALTRLAHTYGNAAEFFGEVHPSEANYVALLAGSTFGIHDDDGFACKPGSTEASCPHATAPGYANHTVDTPHLGTQLAQAGLTWKGYYEGIPQP